MIKLVKKIIKVGGKVGVPQGGPLSPLAANIYLNEVDWFFDAVRRKWLREPTSYCFEGFVAGRGTERDTDSPQPASRQPRPK